MSPEKTALLLALALVAVPGHAWTPGPVASSDLAKVDRFRSLGKDMAFDLKVSAFKDSVLIDEYRISGYSGTSRDGKPSSLVSFNSPAVLRGRKMLLGDFGMWVLFPRTRNVIRLSPMQVLLGEVSNGDIARLSFSQDYDAILDTCIAESKTSICRLVLKVRPEKKGTTYNLVHLWVEEGTWVPRRAAFFSSVGSEKLLKSAEYGQMRTFEGRQVVSRISLVDGIDPRRRSVMEYLSMKSETLPPSSFTKEYLQVWAPAR